MIKPWPTIGSTHVGDFRIFTLRNDRKVSPRTQREHDFFVLDSANWVLVLALTPDKQLVMVEQFRHGTNTVELEIPGGVMDKTDKSPLETAVRELREETGYTGENPRLLSTVYANPAILTNTCYAVLLENCRLTRPTELDSGEDLLTRLVPVASLPGMVAGGKIRHSLVVAALYQFDLWQRGVRG